MAVKEKIKIRIGGHELELTNLDKVFYPAEGITKGDVIGYYMNIAGRMLPLIKGRLITMKRYPEGILEGEFYQKSAPEYFPDWINRVEVELKEMGKQVYITCDNKETLIYLANLAVIPHVWTSRVDRLRYPDRMIFDLDPPGEDFEPVRYAALIFRELLKQAGLQPYLMTTGSRGLHVVVPLDRKTDFEGVRDFARRFAEYVITLDPGHFTLEFKKEKRGNRLFIDIFRNSFAQTAVAPYAVREHPGAPVATPISWDELSDKGLNSRTYTIKNIFRKLAGKPAPWKDINRRGHSLQKSLPLLEKLQKG